MFHVHEANEKELYIADCVRCRFNALYNNSHGFPVFSTLIEANYIKRVKELINEDFTSEEKKEIRKQAKNPDIKNMIINSIAPSIYGHTDVKTAIALSMFGGKAKDI